MCMLLMPSFTWVLTLFASVHSPLHFKQMRQSTSPIHWFIQLYIVSCGTIDLLEKNQMDNPDLLVVNVQKN